MLKKDVKLGATYKVRLHGTHTTIRLDSISAYGGWNATNLITGRTIRIKSAAKLRSEVTNLTCPKCGEDVWDGPKGYKLAKCWAEGCMTAFDTMEEDN